MSKEELMLIAAIVAIVCFMGMAAIAVVLFLWFKKKKAAEQGQIEGLNVGTAPSPPPAKGVESNYVAFTPPPASSPINHAPAERPKQGSPSLNENQTIDLEPHPLANHVPEFDAIEPMSQPFPKADIDNIVPQAPIDTLDSDPMTDLDAGIRDVLADMGIDEDEIDEIGENDATVLMQRPSRPKG